MQGLRVKGIEMQMNDTQLVSTDQNQKRKKKFPLISGFYSSCLHSRKFKPFLCLVILQDLLKTTFIQLNSSLAFKNKVCLLALALTYKDFGSYHSHTCQVVNNKINQFYQLHQNTQSHKANGPPRKSGETQLLGSTYPSTNLWSHKLKNMVVLTKCWNLRMDNLKMRNSLWIQSQGSSQAFPPGTSQSSHGENLRKIS